MSIVLYHHPYSRAATCVWMLEEVGVPYELRFVDLSKGEQKSPDFVALNPMGKLPVLVDGEVVVSETAAIGLYLADRYALGRLAPAPDDPARGAYLRWALFSPSVIEPGLAAKANGWAGRPGSLGWGTLEAMLASIDAAIGDGPYLLGARFTMVDMIFGSTLRYMVRFKMLEPSATVTRYLAQLATHELLVKADARNAEIVKAHGLATS